MDGTLARIAGAGSTDPFVRALAQQMLVDIDPVQGRLDSAAKRVRALGYLQDGYVLGGFDNEQKSGCDVDYGPEAKLDLAATYQAKASARWRTAPVRSLDGGVDLGAMLRPAKGAGWATRCCCSTTAARRTTLALGTRGLPGLAERREGRPSDAYHPARADQERFSVQPARA